MNGLLQIALKLLANDKGKFFTLIIGITFAVFLMMQMTSVFSGVMHRSAATIFNINAKMWVMDPSVNIQSDNIPMPDYVLDAVRSINGVKYAVSFYSGSGLIKLNNGQYQSATIIGLDDATLFGRPEITRGNIYNIYNNDAYIVVKDAEYHKLNSPDIGATFEVNDHRGVVVGHSKAFVNGLFGTPTLYTTYTRAISDLPITRFTISYILVEPKSNQDISYIKRQVHRLGYLALTQDEFITKNTNYYLYQTGLGTNVLIMTLISFIEKQKEIFINTLSYLLGLTPEEFVFTHYNPLNNINYSRLIPEGIPSKMIVNRPDIQSDYFQVMSYGYLEKQALANFFRHLI